MRPIVAPQPADRRIRKMACQLMNPPLCPEMCASASPTSLVVPRQHESVLVVPCADDLPDLILANSQRLASADSPVDGTSFQQLRDEAREADIAEAISYTSS